MDLSKAALIEELISNLGSNGTGNFIYGGAVRSYIDGWQTDIDELDIFTPTKKQSFKASYFRDLRTNGWFIEKIKSYVGHSLYSASKDGYTITLDVRYGLDEKKVPFTKEDMHADISNLKMDSNHTIKMMHGDTVKARNALIAKVEAGRCEMLKFNAETSQNLKNAGFEILNEEKLKMSEKPNFMNMLKDNATSAAYRVAATQMTNGIQAGILKVMESKGMTSEKIGIASDLLDTEFGKSLIALILGFGLNYAPVISEDPRAKKLAEEFRVNGMATAGNAVVGVAMEHFLPVITNAMASLPAAEEAATTSVVDALKAKPNEEEELEDESETIAKAARA